MGGQLWAALFVADPGFTRGCRLFPLRPCRHNFLQAFCCGVQNESAVKERLDDAHHRIKIIWLWLPTSMRGGASSIRKNIERVLLARANLAEPSQFRQLLAKALGRIDTQQVRSSVEGREDADGRQDVKVIVEGDVNFIKQGIEVAIDGKQLDCPRGLLSLRGRGPVGDFGTRRVPNRPTILFGHESLPCHGSENERRCDRFSVDGWLILGQGFDRSDAVHVWAAGSRYSAALGART